VGGEGGGEAVEPDAPGSEVTSSRRSFAFPSAVTTLVLVTVVVWVAALFIPAGRYQLDADGSPVPGTYEQVPSPLSFGQKVEQLVLAPVNGTYGLQDPATEVVSTDAVGRMFGQIGVIVFIMAIGAFISVSFATRSLEVAIGALASRLRSRGWLLIAAVMVLFSLLGSTMGFSVETLGFYALFVPLMAALGYDRLTTAAMLVVGALTGVTASTVNPFSVGVAAGEAGVSIGDGLALRLVLWVVLTAMSVGWVLRYAARVKDDPTRSLVGGDDPDGPAPSTTDAMAEHLGHEEPGAPHSLDRTQKWVLVIMAAAFGVMIFSVIPWSSIVGATTGPADDVTHVVAAEPYWFELNWWFPQLAMLFVGASILVGVVARLGERETVRLIGAGAADMITPALVVLLAGGVSVIMTNTQTLDTVLNSMEQMVSGASAGGFALITVGVNALLAIVIPSSSGHATLAMPLLAPLADFAGVDRSTMITGWMAGHGLTLLWSPTSVVLVGGLAIARVRYDHYLRFVWPLLVAMAVVSTAAVALSTSL
jgi:uncharacterized ion transporter superfamily protein YfcC